jgi:hypothetical protein
MPCIRFIQVGERFYAHALGRRHAVTTKKGFYFTKYAESGV